MAKNPNAAAIKNNTNRRRTLMSQIKTLRRNKQQQMKSIDGNIKSCKDVNQRRTYRSRKADIRESFNYRIESLQKQAKTLLEQNKRMRNR
jgi:DNA polymerase II small subunit/DNA polymerase delta subunit B